MKYKRDPFVILYVIATVVPPFTFWDKSVISKGLSETKGRAVEGGGTLIFRCAIFSSFEEASRGFALFYPDADVTRKHVCSFGFGILFIGGTMIDLEIMSNESYEKVKREKEFRISFGFQDSPFGRCLVGLSGDRVCHFSFVNTVDSANLNALKAQWPGSVLITDEKLTAEVVEKIFHRETQFVKVLLKGTHFEGKVWEALVNIPKGETMSYGELAAATGCGRAIRAAANAVAKNPVAYLVPCHRVIRKDGSLHKYRWGSQVKKNILLFEKCDI